MIFACAQQIADAVLYEGYVLYPYRASAIKNRLRWQFGVVMPRDLAGEGAEPWWMQTECLIKPDVDMPLRIDLRARFLQVGDQALRDSQGASVAVLDIDGVPHVAFDPGAERVVDGSELSLDDLREDGVTIPLAIAGGVTREEMRDPAGVRRGYAETVFTTLTGCVHASIVTVAPELLKLRVRLENHTPCPVAAGRERAVALRYALVGAHTMLAVRGGVFLSALDPPPEAAEAVAACRNDHTWPVLAGPPGRHDVMLSSPIILYDHPTVAPESAGDFCDATEIDELLTLRVMAMTEAETQEARGSGGRARSIVERVEAAGRSQLAGLHGARRDIASGLVDSSSLEQPGVGGPNGAPPGSTVFPEADDAEDFFGVADLPEEVRVDVKGTAIRRGAAVVLRPRRRADSMDMFLAGRTARVHAIRRDVDGRTWLAVTVEDDPGADMHLWYGRFFHFEPDEVEPIDVPVGTDVMTGIAKREGGNPDE